MIFVRINCPNFVGLVWRRQAKFQIGKAAALPAIPLPAPLPPDVGESQTRSMLMVEQRVFD